MTEPRGERLNNPTDIRREPNQTWVGQTPVQSDAQFVEFQAPQYGYRASNHIIMRHYVAGKTTVADVCSHWAPPAENNTKAYIAAVEARMGQNGPLVLPAQMSALLHAITVQELGFCPYDDSVIIAGIELDGVKPSVAAPAEPIAPTTQPEPTAAPAAPQVIPMPEPDPISNKWIPSRKLITGGIVGQAAAQIIVAICDQYFKTPLSPELAAAVTTLCYAVAAYFIPNN